MSNFKLVKLIDPTAIVIGGLVPKGTFNAATTYTVGDSVSYNGSSYVLFATAVAGTLPTDTSKWQYIAQKGDAGATGAVGPDKNFVHNFVSSSSVTVTHNLGKKPAVTVIDSAGDEAIGDVNHVSNNSLTVVFNLPFTGTVNCN